jgi:hypothetical protein
MDMVGVDELLPDPLLVTAVAELPSLPLAIELWSSTVLH